MTFCKLMVRNVGKHIHDYLIYFMTLTISVSLFYAFHSAANQSALSEMGMTRSMLYGQMGRLLSLLSVFIAVVLAFLMIYANQFLLRRRKRELGIYMMLGMRKGRIARLFAGETLLVGLAALAGGLLLGLLLSQGLCMVTLKLFDVELEQFRIVFSRSALAKTAQCFAVMFLIVMVCNVRSVSGVKLIDLFAAGRKNEEAGQERGIPLLLRLLLALGCVGTSCGLFWRYGILPVRENPAFWPALILLAVGTLLFFSSAWAAAERLIRARGGLYFKGLNAFVMRQIGSRFRGNYLVMTAVCALLTVSVCTVSAGIGIGMSMNQLSRSAAPYDLNVTSVVEADGDGSIAEYLRARGIDMEEYAADARQISIYSADFTYGDLFAGQKLDLWPIDEGLEETSVAAVSVTDFNQALAMQGKEPISLGENEYLINCNYEGTFSYVVAALNAHPTLTVAGVSLERASADPLQETYVMTSINNNDRGTLILPDEVASALEKDNNVLLVLYRPGTNPDEVLEKMIPIGLDEEHHYRYAERQMMYDGFYGLNALVSFLCSYVGLIFLLICAALLSLKLLTETADGRYRYRLLTRLGAGRSQITGAFVGQTVVFFAAPLAVALLYASVLLGKIMEVVGEFMNMHISANVWFAAAMLLVVYGGYFAASCAVGRSMILDGREDRLLQE